ncbi:YceI family protein [Flavobacterium hydrophilum]|uniref:Lipid-binding protein n=1 Tax=Flavobacterium hydrophilum TaxID=2211445 RepID=A0A2V4BZ01_9FLAO|nr:YceI family protein [Flavobacterium hydrophilum]PXY43937.1 lipid-binding protein [Flavobacterium hydrophilum]
MNNKLSITYLILIITPIVFSCRGPVKEENKNNTLASSLSVDAANEKYVIDIKESVVTWKGSNLLGSNNHTGYVYISKGELIIKNGNLMGGTAEVDMNTIEDEKHGRNNGLVDHLKEPDFFDVKKFPSSTIVLSKAAPINSENRKVAGNLTIKGITQPVTFPAKMEIKDGIAKLNGRLVIDRTKWDIRYKSGKFYDLLADQTISDSIEFYIKIVAKR